MRIIVCPADWSGCGYYRMVSPFSALAEKYGHSVAFADNTGQTIARPIGTPSAIKQMKLTSIFEDADIIVLQRQTNPKVLQFVHHAHASGQKIIFELDDNISALPTTNPNAKEYGSGKPATKTMLEFMRLADRCIVSTPELAEEYRKYNPHISICYNAIADQQFHRIAPVEIRGTPKREGEIRIGYAGSTTHQGDFAVMMSALVKIMQANPEVRMVFIGHDMRLMMPESVIRRCEFAGSTASPENLTGEQLGDHSMLSSVKYYDLIKASDLDIQIAPLANLTFNRSKSYLKVMEAGAMGIPIVCSRFGPYRQYQDEAPEGIPVVASCVDVREWRSTLEYLIGSALFRRQIAQANLKYVQRHHLMSQKVDQWAEAVDQVAGLVAA